MRSHHLSTFLAVLAMFAIGQQSLGQTPPSPADLKKRYAERTAALHEAAEKGQVSLLHELIKAGADVNDKDEHGKTALHKAAEKGNRSATILLIMFGGDAGEKDVKGQNAMHVAAAAGQTELVTLLTKPYDFASVAGDFIKGSVSDAIKGGLNLKGATDKFVSLSGSSMSAVDSLGQTPIMKAAANGHTECVRAIGLYYDKSQRDKQGRTALMLAAAGGHTEMIRAIWPEANIAIDYLQATDPEGKTAEQIAEASKHPATAKLLKEMEQKALAQAHTLKLLKLAKDNDVAGLKGELLKSDSGVSHTDLMIAAATNGNTQVVRFLMDFAKDKPIEEKARLMGFPLAYGTRPDSAFHLAAKNGHLETLKAITDMEWWKDAATLADIMKRKNVGSAVYQTPLEIAMNSSISGFIEKKLKELDGKK
jgi:ankyrin repeat protein